MELTISHSTRLSVAVATSREKSTYELGDRVMVQGYAVKGMVLVFENDFTLEDAIGSYGRSLEASMHVTNSMPLASSLFLPVDTVNCVATLKVLCDMQARIWARSKKTGHIHRARTTTG
jgi:hypothetical protein